MLLTNYHTHCEFCDGKGDPEEYILQAIKKGFHALGFSTHAPISNQKDWTIPEESIPDYLNKLESLKAKYRDKIEIYKGFEIDYLEGISGPSSVKFNRLNLDYKIGSVHMIPANDPEKFLAIDGSSKNLEILLKSTFNNEIEKMVEKYYGLIRDMLAGNRFEILGHFDLVKKRNSNNAFFSESSPWYHKHVLKTLDAIAESDVILEVNTGGLSRGAINSIYPSPWILKESSNRGIPITLNADAHDPLHIDFYFDESLKIIRDCGYRELHSLYGGKWISSKI